MKTQTKVKTVIKAGYGNKKAKKQLAELGYEQDQQLSNHNQQVLYHPQDDRVVLNVTGTHNLSDVGTDVALAFGRLKNTKRYKEAQSTLQQARQKYPGRDVSITGHSLGGTIGGYIGDPKDNVVTFNKGATIGQNTRSNEKAYRTAADPVSMAIAFSKNVHNVHSNVFPTTFQSLIDSHSSDNLPDSVTI